MRVDERRTLIVLRAILAAGILSTAIHYTHNFVAVSHYPGPGGFFYTIIRIAIVVAWPLLTYIGLLGYRRFREGRYQEARAAFITYSYTGLTSILHFVFGNPKIPAFFYATLFTDFLTGLSVLLFALWLGREAEPRLSSAS